GVRVGRGPRPLRGGRRRPRGPLRGAVGADARGGFRRFGGDADERLRELDRPAAAALGGGGEVKADELFVRDAAAAGRVRVVPRRGDLPRQRPGADALAGGGERRLRHAAGARAAVGRVVPGATLGRDGGERRLARLAHGAERGTGTRIPARRRQVGERRP